jgi:molecular chaperone IbpA
MQPTGGYPPYDITSDGNGLTTIAVALAGLKQSDIDIYVEGNTLNVKYEKPEVKTEFDPDKTHTVGEVLEEGKLSFIHKGIARRSFNLSWKLKPGVEVKSASMEDGMLRISLKKTVVEPERKKIEIQ